MKKLFPTYALYAVGCWCAAALLCFGAFAADDVADDAQAPPITAEADQISYIVGIQFGSTIQQLGLDINFDVLVRGMRDLVEDNELAMSEEALESAMMLLQQKMTEAQEEMQREQMTRQREEGGRNLAASNAFLAENAGEDGVVTSESGLQYRVLSEGDGDTPHAESRVRVHYRGTLMDGTQFDSSYDRGQPAEFKANQVIQGWQEALQLMPVGSKWQLFIPPNLAYGEAGRPGIPPNSLLIFEVELLEIVG